MRDRGAGDDPLARIRRRLEEHRPERIGPGEVEQRAAVALLLRAPAGGAERSDDLLALFIRRAEAEDDPWAGHVGLPGGRSEPGDRDLAETARRETREETGIRLDAGDLLGRLSDLRPGSPHLPSVGITPYVARHSGSPEIRPSHEVQSHVWVPVGDLRAPDNRSRLVVERFGERREFPTIEYAGHVIWGLTHEIVRRFLALAEGA